MIRRLFVSAIASAALLGAVRALPHVADSAWAAARTGSASVDDLVGLMAVVMAYAVLGWVGLLSALAAAARVPGMAGRAAARAAHRLTPSLAAGLTRLAVGVAVVSTPVVGAIPAAAGVGAPVRSPDADDTADIATTALPGVGRPGHTPVGPDVAGPAPTDRPPPRSGAAPTPADVMVVNGDCLWTIAAHALGPDATDAEIAAAWPRWYARNRAVVGADPDLLIPGTVLRPPAQH
ncbi:MAG: LysM peptidoglycan-binding domain-containing protein [Jiangellaceae bacterium]